EIGVETAVWAVCSERTGGIAGGGSRKFLEAKLLRHRDCHRHPACLEALSGIERFVLHVELSHAERGTEVSGVMQRSPALAQRDDVVLAPHWQHFAIAPDIRPARVKSLARQKLGDALQIIAYEARLAALRAAVVNTCCLVFAVAARALEALAVRCSGLAGIAASVPWQASCRRG